MVAITLGGFDLGNCETINVIKNGNVELAPLPRKDSSLTKLFDFNGATQTVSLSGTYTDTSAANIKSNFLDNINGILDGDQGVVSVFASDATGSINVLIQSFQWNWDINTSEYIVRWDIELIEGVKGGQ